LGFGGFRGLLVCAPGYGGRFPLIGESGDPSVRSRLMSVHPSAGG
jgi:hypothetical protein